jgi:hypothetical protein
MAIDPSSYRRKIDRVIRPVAGFIAFWRSAVSLDEAFSAGSHAV